MDSPGWRLSAELALLESMYPDRVRYDEKAREVNYRSESGSFTLRLPAGYLVDELPDVLSATAGRDDLCQQLKKRVKETAVGEEILDAIVLAFDGLCDVSTTQPEAVQSYDSSAAHQGGADATLGTATVVVWLHHLLNTNKRKQALSPPSTGVSGITKPGYPGVLIYSGPAKAVHEHVNELKGLNWAAFQVRLESDAEWTFAHGSGVKEVRAMKDVVAAVGDERKEIFMEAMRMR